MNEVGNFFRGVGNTIIAYIPNVLGAALLLLIAWVVATIVRAIFTKGLKKSRSRQSHGQRPYGKNKRRCR